MEPPSSPADLVSFSEKVTICFTGQKEKIEWDERAHWLERAEVHWKCLFARENEGVSSRKHRVQQIGIISLMEERGLFDEEDVAGVVVVELAAGKAGLSRALAQRIEERRERAAVVAAAAVAGSCTDPPGSPTAGNAPKRQRVAGSIIPAYHHVLLDRDVFNNKEDRHFPGYPSCLERVTIDLKDVVLDNLAPSRAADPILCLGKHLCGQATDLALLASHSSARTRALCIATCCHHQCDLRNYVGMGWLRSVGFSDADFDALRRISSWYTGFLSDTQRDDQKVEVGRRAKLLLDFGRVVWLREQGWDAHLSPHCPQDISPENRVITAKRK